MSACGPISLRRSRGHSVSEQAKRAGFALQAPERQGSVPVVLCSIVLEMVCEAWWTMVNPGC